MATDIFLALAGSFLLWIGIVGVFRADQSIRRLFGPTLLVAGGMLLLFDVIANLFGAVVSPTGKTVLIVISPVVACGVVFSLRMGARRRQR